MDEESIIVESQPQRLGRYELVTRLGTGGFAEIYLARYAGADGFVAEACVKRVFPENAGDPEHTDSMRDEAVIMNALSHPNILKVFEYLKVSGQHFIVMQYVDGASLADLLKYLTGEKRPFPWHLALYVMYRVLQALDAAHRLVQHGTEQRVIHRDIHPRNILVERNGVPYVIDFGIVKATNRRYRTQTGYARGTLPYMAPESIMSGAPGWESTKQDARTDVYSVGVVLYELLAGRHPYPKMNEGQLAKAIVEGTHPRLSELQPELPVGLAELVERMMALEMSRRPESALEACELLCPFLFGDPRAELRMSRELAEFVERAIGHRPPRSANHPRPHDVNTVTRVRKAPDPDHSPADSGVLAKASVAGAGADRSPPPNDEPSPSHAVQTETLSPPGRVPKTVRKYRANRLFIALTFLTAVGVGAALALQNRADDTVKIVDSQSNPAAKQSAPAAKAADEPPRKSTAALATPTVAAPSAEGMASVTEAAPAASEAPRLEPAHAAAKSSGSNSTKLHADAHVASEPTSTGAEKNAWLDIHMGASDTSWQVWVDGQYCGTGDVKVKVTPGKHVVEVGASQPTIKRMVRVSAHGTRQVTFEH